MFDGEIVSFRFLPVLPAADDDTLHFAIMTRRLSAMVPQWMLILSVFGFLILVIWIGRYQYKP